MKPSKVNVKTLIETKLKCNVSKIKDSSKGEDQIVKIVDTDNGKFVVKFPKDKHMIHRQVFANDKLKGKIPLAEIVYYDDECIIEAFILGNELDDICLKDGDAKKVFFQLGEILSEIHQINIEGCGFIEDQHGKYNSMKEFIDNYWLKGRLEDLLKYKTVTKKEMYLIEEYLIKNEYLQKSEECCLLHFDYVGSNIKVNKGDVSGIIDFADIISGPKEFDFSRLYIAHHQDGLFDFILKGYSQKLDMNKIRYYSALTLMRLLPYFEDADPEQYKRGLKLLWEIVSK